MERCKSLSPRETHCSFCSHLPRFIWGKYEEHNAFFSPSFYAAVHFWNPFPQKYEQMDEKGWRILCSVWNCVLFLGASYRKLHYYRPFFLLSWRTCLLYQDNQTLHFWGTEWTSGKKNFTSLDIQFLTFWLSEIHKMLGFYIVIQLHACIWA